MNYGFYASYSYWGLINGKWMEFASEEEYMKYIKGD